MHRFFYPSARRADVPARPPRRGYEALAANLEALASETRLELLHDLRTPRALHEIRVSPSSARPGENPERPISRQAVARHLQQLQELGLLHRVPTESGRGEGYVLNHERLFAVVDELRNLAKLRPVLTGTSTVGATLDRAVEEVRLPEPPRLLVAYGRDDGVAFALHGERGTAWRIGRSPGCEIRLDYDPFLSSRHATVERLAEGFELQDEGNRNGTWVNWERMPRGGRRRLASGDLVSVGRTLLVFQSPS